MEAGAVSTADDLKRLEREIERDQRQAQEELKPLTSIPLLPPAKGSKPYNSFDLILLLAAALAIIAMGVNTVRQMPEQQAKTFEDGLIGGATGLLVGYGIGRFRP
jgi:hypothetical protein